LTLFLQVAYASGRLTCGIGGHRMRAFGALGVLRNFVASHLQMASIRRHRSRLGRDLAPKYSRYLKQAQSAAPVSKTGTDDIFKRAERFRHEGYAAFNSDSSRALASSMWTKIREEEQQGLPVWDKDGRYALGDIYTKFDEVDQLFRSDLGDFLRACYGVNFKIFYGVCYKSTYDPSGASGSQLWHADGGPGTCMNLMWCLSPVSRENGAMECLPWGSTLKVFQSEHALRSARGKTAAGKSARDVICEHYEAEIRRSFTKDIVQPKGDSGLLFAFSNNLIHKGGYPQPGQERYVCVFHIYPSAVPTPFDRYKTGGIGKSASYPSDPGFGDLEQVQGGVK